MISMMVAGTGFGEGVPHGTAQAVRRRRRHGRANPHSKFCSCSRKTRPHTLQTSLYEHYV